MKLTNIHVENVIGLRHLDISINLPVLLVAGGNGAGKTSIAHAIRLALTGEASRVSLKKEWSALVSEGAKSGKIIVSGHHEDPDVGEWDAIMALPSGKRGGSVPVHASAALPYALDMHRFAGLDDKERRVYLFGMMGVTMSAGGIVSRLDGKGANPDKVAEITESIRLGFAVAEAAAKENASRARGAWEGVAGEKYGEKKAENWKPAPVQFEQSALGMAEEILRAVETEIGEINKQIGAANTVNAGIEAKRKQVNDLRAKADKFGHHRAMLDVARAELDDFRPKVEELRAKATGVAVEAHYECPHCEGAFVMRNGIPQVYEAPDELSLRDSGAAAKLPEYQKSLQMLERSLANRTRDYEEADQAANQAKLIEDELAGLEHQETDDMQQHLDALAASRDQTRRERDALLNAQQAAELAAAAGELAAGHHKDVLEWTALASFLSPDGILGEILAEALNPINNLLRQFAVETGWMQASIGADMSIHAGGRPYALLSESEQWRVDAMFTVAIANLSGLKLAVLDRFDVLEPSARPDLIYWLDAMAEDGRMDTIITLGTMKSAPSGMPERVQVHWLGSGALNNEQMEAAA